MYVQRIPPTHTDVEPHVKSVVFWGGLVMFGIKHLSHNLCFLLGWDNTDNGLYEPHLTTFPRPTTVGYLRHACKKGCCSSCKCKKATCIALSWCEATGQRYNSCITILHIMYHNWTGYALYNWSNITRWNAWLCGASLREQHAAGGRQNI